MIAWINTDEDGRITASTTFEEYSKGMMKVDIPDDFDFLMQSDYIYKDGQLTYDNAFSMAQENAQIEYERKIKEDAQLKIAARMFIRANATMLTDVQAATVSLLFEKWTIGVEYKKGSIIRYDGELYRVGQDHTSQEQWVPGAVGTESLYSHIVIGNDGYEDWKEWDGITGLYQHGQDYINMVRL